MSLSDRCREILKIADPDLRIDSLSDRDVILEALNVAEFAVQEWHDRQNLRQDGDTNALYLVSGAVLSEYGVPIADSGVAYDSNPDRMDSSTPTRKVVRWNGLRVGITHEAGKDYRFGSQLKDASYGRLFGSYGDAPDKKAHDFYVANDFDPEDPGFKLYAINQLDPESGEIDETKFGIFRGGQEFKRAYQEMLPGNLRDRMFGGVRSVDISELQQYREDAYHADSCGCEACQAKKPCPCEEPESKPRTKRGRKKKVVEDVKEEGDRADAETPAEEKDVADYLVEESVKKSAPVFQGWANKITSWLGGFGSLEEARQYLTDHPSEVFGKLPTPAIDKLFFETLLLADLAARESVLEGDRLDSLIRNDAQRPEWLRLPFKEAVNYFRKKVTLPSNKFSRLQKGYHDYAFTLANVARADVLEDTKWLLDRAISEGDSLDNFKKSFARLVGRKGWRPGERRLELIFDTNVRGAYGAGRYEQMSDPDVTANRGLWLWRHRDSPNFRPEHKALHNKAIPANHKFWDGLRVPAGFGCFTGDTLVETPDGLRRLDSIQVGDRVIGGSGYINTVSAKHTSPFKEKLVRVVLEKRDGSFVTVQATPNHRILTKRGWVEAGCLDVCDEVIKTVNTPLPKQFLSTDAVAYISHMHTGIRKNGMPLPVTAGGSVVEVASDVTTHTLDTDIEFWNKDINPETFTKMLNVVVVFDNKTTTFQIPHEAIFVDGGFGFSVSVNGRIFSVPDDLVLKSQGSNFRSEKRTRDFELFRDCPGGLASVFSFPKSGVPSFGHVFSDRTFDSTSGYITSSGISDMLHSDRFTPSSGEIVEAQQSHNCAVVYPPQFNKFCHDHLVIDIPKNKGVFNGHLFHFLDTIDNDFLNTGFMLNICIDDGDMVSIEYLNDRAVTNTPSSLQRVNAQSLVDMQVDQHISNGSLFNFFNDFCVLVDWISFHGETLNVVNVEYVHLDYSTNVFDLSVYPDQAYNLEIGVVHNCRCSTFSISEDYAKRNNIEILENPPDPDTIADPGFRTPFFGATPEVRQAIIDEKLSQYSGEMRSAVEQELRSKGLIDGQP